MLGPHEKVTAIAMGLGEDNGFYRQLRWVKALTRIYAGLFDVSHLPPSPIPDF
jgi:hypothetical protein